jgi:hypothetical protein
MAGWVSDAVGGKVGVAPKFPPKNGRRKVPMETDELMRDAGLVSSIMAAIDGRWISGSPLSPHPQTAKTGRYAPKVIAKAVGAAQRDIGAVIEALMMRGDIEVVTFNQRMKTKGLRVVSKMEMDNG